MPDLPDVGTRVSVRYRLVPDSVPPLSDVVGHLIDVGPILRIRDKRGDVVSVAAADVLVLRALPPAPVRTSAIRNLEHAAALGWPGVERAWVDGWLLRYGHGSTRRANSAVPLLPFPHTDHGPIVDWYAARGLRALLAAPDRLFTPAPGTATDGENLVLTRQLDPSPATHPSDVVIATRPDDDWLGIHPRRVPSDVLTAVVDGEVAFATVEGVAVGRGAVTAAPDGTRWVGLSSVHVAEAARGRGLARGVCNALLDWGIARGAERAYVQVLTENVAAIRLYESMAFGAHHRSRYVSLG